MAAVRISNVALVLLAVVTSGCPPEAPAPIKERKIPVEVLEVKKPVVRPKVEPVELPPEPEPDPPGTIYTWEDSAGALHITQTPPPRGASLKKKELPRVAPPQTEVEKVAPVDEKAKRMLTRINGLRRNPIASASSLPKTPSFEPAFRKLKGGRRAYVALDERSELDKALTAGVPGATFRGGSELVARSDDPDTALMEWLSDPASLEVLLRPDARVVAAQCSRGCRVIIATSTTRVR